jgi:hypothetical protein
LKNQLNAGILRRLRLLRMTNTDVFQRARRALKLFEEKNDSPARFPSNQQHDSPCSAFLPSIEITGTATRAAAGSIHRT